MTVTQFIGARYVPIFAEPAEWDDIREYEPLTIVVHEGNSYTSKQAVPRGIEIDNEEFWALTGNYNAQVEGYRREVRQFDGRITTLEEHSSTVDSSISDIEDTLTGVNSMLEGVNAALDQHDTDIARLGNSITNVENDVETLQGGLSSAQESISTLETDMVSVAGAVDVLQTQAGRVNEQLKPYGYYKGFNAVFIGDSYAYGTGASDHGSGDTKRFTSLLAARLGAVEFNYAVGSTGFCDPGSGGQNAPFKTQVLTAASAMTATQRSETHLVVIAGGVNDFNEGATYNGDDMRAGARDAAVNARDNFPNANVVIVPMLFKGHDANARLLNFENSIVNGVQGQNPVQRCHVITGAWTWNFGITNNFNSDKLHPNDAGHQQIASRIYAGLEGGFYPQNQLVLLEMDSGYTPGDGGYVASGLYMQFYNGLCAHQGMYIRGNIAANTNTKIGSVGGQAVPLMNVQGIISSGNRFAGMYTITNSGNIYVQPTVDIETFFMQPLSYIPCGRI